MVGFAGAVVLHLIGDAALGRPAALGVDLVADTLTLALLVAFVSPLWSVHTVCDDGTAHLRLGLLGSVAVHPGDVARARSFTPTPARPAKAGAGFDERTGRLSLIRSPASPLVFATFTRPVPARVRLFRRVLAAECLVSTDDAHRLVATLAPGPRS